MIGYYVHHQGSGHLQRASVLAAQLSMPVTGLSSLPRPAGWRGDWVQLERDDELMMHPYDAEAHGRLHWVPLADGGLRRRMSQISAWIERCSPAFMIVDVSVEVMVFARMHGIPVATVVLPGARTDRAHRLGFDLAEAVFAMWPPQALGVVQGLDEGQKSRFHAVGGLSRFSAGVQGSADVFSLRPPAPQAGALQRVIVVNGRGGGEVPAAAVEGIALAAPHAEVIVLGGTDGTWVAEPWPLMRDADLIVCHAGQNVVAEVAASRTPAVVMALPRPFDEQEHLLVSLVEGSWPVVPAPGSTVRSPNRRSQDAQDSADDPAAWAAAVRDAAGLDGRGWDSWVDGLAGVRFARIAEELYCIHGKAG